MLPSIVSTFFPPELAVQEDLISEEAFHSGNDIDLLKQVYFQRLRSPKREPALDRELVAQVLEHARKIIAHPSKPLVPEQASFFEKPFQELALEETLEDNPLLSYDAPIYVEGTRPKPFSCVAMLDCSASMSGDKHLLGAVAVAVLLLEIPPQDTSVIVFSSQARSVKPIARVEPSAVTLLNFLAVQPRGFTNIHAALREGLGQLGSSRGRRRRVGLIATDGRSTEGGDPLVAAKEYDFLVVLHLHGPGSHVDASREIAARGNGICLEVEELSHLPRRMYDAIRLLSRL